MTYYTRIPGFSGIGRTVHILLMYKCHSNQWSSYTCPVLFSKAHSMFIFSFPGIRVFRSTNYLPCHWGGETFAILNLIFTPKDGRLVVVRGSDVTPEKRILDKFKLAPCPVHILEELISCHKCTCLSKHWLFSNLKQLIFLLNLSPVKNVYYISI
jgi:hypothetical protein